MRKISLLNLAFCGLFLGTVVAQTPVVEHGALSVSGNQIKDKNGSSFQMRGMSLYWSQWPEGSRFYNANVVSWLKNDWCANVIRAAMAVDNGGYASNESEKNKIFTVIDAAITNGIYVIVDFHVHDATSYKSQAIKFFGEVAQKYGNKPNVLYEIWNEPITQEWTATIKPYAVDVINEIRKYDSDNIIIVGTKTYSQRVDEVVSDPISGTNIAYTFHFYANTHKVDEYATTTKTYRQLLNAAYQAGLAVVVTEYGTCDANGNGTINQTETEKWWSLLDARNMSYVNWAISDKSETSAALYGGASSDGGWSASNLTPSGKFVRDKMKARCVAVGLDESSKLNSTGIQCYPNPFSNDFTIKAEGAFEYSIYDMTGNTMETGHSTGTTLVGSQLQSGLYLVKTTDAKGSKFTKVSKL